MGINSDICYAKWICKSKRAQSYQKIYFETNELLDDLFNKIDFNDKNVLSVLSSSDQLFKLNALGVKNIDAFDKNKFTYFYYFFRIWTIEYMNELYPTGLILNDYNWINILLSYVEPSSLAEANALRFWNSLCKSRVDFSKFFLRDWTRMLDYSNGSCIKKLPLNLNFFNLNLFKKNNFKMNYDIAVISNILEWSRGDSRFLDILNFNLYNLLADNGVVLCSKLIYDDNICGVDIRKALKDFKYYNYGENYYIYKKNN